MKSLLLTLITLTCTTQLFCAASSSSSPEETNDDDRVGYSMMYNFASDGFAIAAYHDRVPADPYWYPEGPATGNQFGAALIPASPLVAATIHWNREQFKKKGSTDPYFKVDDTNPIDLSSNFFATSLCAYTRDPMYGKRYLLLCPYKEHAETVKTVIEGDADKPSTLEDMFALVQKLLPATTFVLFDAGVYCEYRDMQPISYMRREMRAWTDIFKAMAKQIKTDQPRQRAQSAEIASRRIFTPQLASHIRTGSLDETKSLSENSSQLKIMNG